MRIGFAASRPDVTKLHFSTLVEHIVTPDYPDATTDLQFIDGQRESDTTAA
jgi:hypothetical protein